MAKIRIEELEVEKSTLKVLNEVEAIYVIGGHDEEAESSRDIIQKAMQEAVSRSDMSMNGKSRALNRHHGFSHSTLN